MSEQNDTNVKELITCSLCSQIFTRPKAFLPCLHTFCEGCIVGWLQKGNTCCPLCNSTLEGKEEGNEAATQLTVQRLPGNYFLNALAERFQGTEEKRVSSEASVTGIVLCDSCDDGETQAVLVCKECGEGLCDLHVLSHRKAKSTKEHALFPLDQAAGLKKAKAKRMCAAHPNEELMLFCEECDDVICRDCITSAAPHIGHRCIVLSDAVSQREGVLCLLRDVAQEEGEVKGLLGKVRKRREEVKEAAMEADRQINAFFDEVAAMVERRRKELCEEVKQREASRCKALKIQEVTLENLLVCAQAGTQRKEQEKEKEKEKESESGEKEKEKMKEEADDDTVELLQMKKYLLHGKKQMLDILMYPQPAVLSLITFAADPVAPTSLVQVGDLGKVNEKQVERRAQKCKAVCIPYDGYPTGIAFDQSSGSIIIVDSSNSCINVYAMDGTPINQFGDYGSGPGRLNQPYGVAVDPNSKNLVVCDTYNHRIQIFSVDGSFVQKFGSFGKEDTNFHFPMGVAIDTTNGNIFVADQENHCVKEFTAEGNFVRKIGNSPIGGGELGQFRNPSSLAINQSANEIIVSDWGNHRIQIFDKTDGSFRLAIGKEGSGDAEFNHPWGVAVDNNAAEIIVADGNNHRLQIFSSKGEFLRQVSQEGCEEGQLQEPYGLALDPASKRLLVADYGNKRIQIFG